MGKTVWIMNHYASHMLFDKGGRHYWFAKYLDRAGYSPVVFCANIQNSKTNERCIDTEDLWTVKEAEDIHTPFVYVKARRYIGNGKQRILNMFDFYRNVKKTAKQYAKKNGKPDIILASSVHPLTMVAGIKLAKKYGVKCVCEVRDLWPEAIVAYSKRIKKNSLPAKIMYAGEKWIYKKADAVIFTQEGGPDYVCEHCWDKKHGGPIDNDKLFHINNGVDLEAFDENLKNFPYADEDLDHPDLYKVVYCGAIRRINNLGIILDTAKLISDPKIKFVIFGNGDELDSLKQRVIDEKITNVVFKGRVNKQFIPSIDSKADLNLVHWEMNPLLRVGESYNKSFEYFAAGKPVFYTVRPGYSIVEKYHCGRLTDGFEPKDLAEGIQKMAEMSDAEKTEMAVNARKTAEVYDFGNLTKKLIEIIERD
ncbi:MAG: glycosyltransferase family 4 protein [Lachnospiraceae bacterium]|nr:glycosyltransferase family 4 protein [Lachnospiraceae bacterium]